MADEPSRDGPQPVWQMVLIGLIASALGIALGLLIDWLPPQASRRAPQIDGLYDVLIVVSVPVFVLVCVVVLFCAWRFRMRLGEEQLDGPPIHGNTRLEIVWTAIPAIILVGLVSYAFIVLRDVEAAQPNEMRVNVIAQQFIWTFEYPQAGGKKVTSNVLYLPQGRRVHFYVTSKDVIHSFFVPAFRSKIDAVPGIQTEFRDTPTRRGRYPALCAELCGVGHAFMRATVNVVSPAQFRGWLERQQAPAPRTPGRAPDGKTLFSQGNGTATGCGSCHVLADAASTGASGPDLDKALADKDAAFIRKSIVNPNAELAPGFAVGIMPPDYGQTLQPDELDALVEYLDKAAGKP